MVVAMEPKTETRPEPLWRLLYRYLWPFQYFRDVNLGTRLERQQNYRHNRAMRCYLPGFAAKWGLLSTLLFGLGATCDGLQAGVLPVAFLYIVGTWALTVMLLVTTAWAWLSRFPEHY